MVFQVLTDHVVATSKSGKKTPKPKTLPSVDITLGTVLGVLAIIIVVCAVWYYRRQKRRKELIGKNTTELANVA